MKKEQRGAIIHGVSIVSRYGVERELIRMRRSVESLPPDLRAEIVEYFADSKAGHHYVIELRSAASADAIAAYLPPLRSAYVGFDFRGERVLEMKGW